MTKKNLLRSLFGYSRGEQSGTLVLICLVIMVLFFSLRKTVEPLSYTGMEESSYESFQIDSINTGEEVNTAYKAELFFFDPNTIEYSDLLLLGLNKRQANTLINYRNSGARFRSVDDFRRVYGIPDTLQDILIPYINIAPAVTIKPDGGGRNKASAIINSKTDSRKPSNLYTKRTKPGPERSININRSDSIELAMLPGIGKVLSRRIVLYRQLLGGYYSIEQINEVYGIDSSLYMSVEKYFVSDTLSIDKIDINTAPYTTLIRHPYISKVMCRQILYYRKVQGLIVSLDELVRNRIISEEESIRIRPYIHFGSSLVDGN